MTSPLGPVLTERQIQRFIEDGFVRIDQAFSREIAAEALGILWRDTGCDPADPTTWTKPVIRLGGYTDPPFARAANTPRLLAAVDQLVGEGRWAPRASIGTFPVRFPSPDDPGDAGWHVDVSFPGEDAADFFTYRANVTSRDRALLMLFLFSDVGELDAPTRIRVGSHLDVARLLEPAGEAGMAFMELAERLDVSAHRPVAFATGEAGTVYLCHPFLVHAAQPHRGTKPRFMGQPPLYSAKPYELSRDDGDYSPVETAIRRGLTRELSRADITRQLRALGVEEGGVLLVHTSFRMARPVEGGPRGLIEALRDALGPNGTLVMPSWSGDDDEPFDPLTTPASPASLGVVAETFWRLPGVLRSHHCQAFAAAGPDAASILADPLPLPPHVPESPVGRVYDLDGQVLLLGVGHDANTTIHLAELLAGVPYRSPAHCTIVQDGRPVRIDYEENDHCCARFAFADEWLRGLQSEGRVGHAHARLARARDIVRVAVEHLIHDPLVFLHPPSAACAECDAARSSTTE